MKCAINDCHDDAAGLMEWPDIHTKINLCQSHARLVGAVERAMSIGLHEVSLVDPGEVEPGQMNSHGAWRLPET